MSKYAAAADHFGAVFLERDTGGQWTETVYPGDYTMGTHAVEAAGNTLYLMQTGQQRFIALDSENRDTEFMSGAPER